jgi:hypothetical protein
MIREDDLQAAVAEGIIDQAQAIRIAHIARMRREATPAPGREWSAAEPRPLDPDDERFRLIGGFNDVFVTIGVGLLASALFGLARALGLGEAFAATGLLVSWGLAEWFSRRMRLALPSIVLAVMFVGCAAMLAVLGGSVLLGMPQAATRGEGLLAIIGGAGVMAAAGLHHWRFRVPIDAALGALGVVAVLAGVFTLIDPSLLRLYFVPITFLMGLWVFFAAMRVDMGDPLRRTRRADTAFWLHMLAAPMIVHPAVHLVTGGLGSFGTAKALGLLLIFVLLGLVALVIDRRALIVSGLSYAGIAIAWLLAARLPGGLGMPLTLLGLATVVLGLSAGWRGLRGALLPLLPAGRWRDGLPPAGPPPIA